MEFLLRIELGNDAMQTAADLAAAIIDTGRRLQSAHVDLGENPEKWDAYDRRHYIRDANGNTVGEWAITPAPALEMERILGIKGSVTTTGKADPNPVHRHDCAAVREFGKPCTCGHSIA